MIVYKEIIQKLADVGWTSYRIRKEKKLPEGTMQRIREGKPVTTTTLDIICSMLNCELSDIVCYVSEKEQE